MENTACVSNEAADKGGVLHTAQTNVTIRHSAFSLNLARNKGGAWYMKGTTILFEQISFTGNAANTGGSMYSLNCNLRSIDSLLVHNTTADIGAVYIYGSTAQFSGKTEISTTVGSCLVYTSNITFKGNTTFVDCSEHITSNSPEMMEGGALTLFKSIVNFHGTNSFVNNRATNGGALQATESKIYTHAGSVTIVTANRAMESGGGMHLDKSELHCQFNSSFNLSSNIASRKGGGIHAIHSVINITGNLIHSNITKDVRYGILFVENKSNRGGGLYLEMTIVYILKSVLYSRPYYIINFVGNSADYGGALYVSDDSNSGLCDPNYTFHFDAKECLFQIRATQSSTSSTQSTSLGQQSMQNIFFSENSANISGSSLFGGLIDRCKVLHYTKQLLYTNNQNKDHQHKIVNGVSYLQSITNIDQSDIGSEPVQLCFCINDLPDCNYQQPTIRIAKDKRFSISLVAVDQVNHSINATIYSSLSSADGVLKKGQYVQNTTKACTNLNFNIFSPNENEELIMSAEGPCKYSSQSWRRFSIQFTACDSCPIGFDKLWHGDDKTVCDCVCDSRLEPYITKCNASMAILERKGSFWITYIKSSDKASSGYLIYPHCPFNYCLPPTSKVGINLNIPGGSNVQCANGHSGILCGVCQSNLSLSLGSSRCVSCSDQWPLVLAVTLVAAFIAGIALVALLLILNLTVATGTLNGIIFYTNIIAANSSIYLPFSTPNFITVFIAWLNLEIGIDICFFPEMDAYWKTLLQLAFPTYVIFLVAMVIVISEHSTKFSRLVAKKNPVSTMATLILLSYTKYLNTVITALSFAVLNYPDGSDHIVWLPDATIQYLRGKHIAIFVVAIIIILAGVVYTALLLSWQLLLQHQYKKVFTWTKHQKLCHFIEPYHAPYTFEQRYWTGLLLLTRVLVYIVSAVNISGDPRVALVSTIVAVGSLPITKGIMERKVYKSWLIGFTEMFMYINIIAFTAFTWYTFDTKKNQATVAYTSVTLTFALLLAVITFHVLFHTGLLSIIQKIKKKIIAFKNGVKYSHWQVGALGNEHSKPLITKSSVEIPKLLESQGSTEIELSSSTHFMAPAMDTGSHHVDSFEVHIKPISP